MSDSLFITNDNCGDNFYNYINNEWINNTEIPHDSQRWSVFQILQNETNEKIKSLLESSTLSPEYYKIKIIFEQAMSENKRNNNCNYERHAEYNYVGHDGGCENKMIMIMVWLA